MTVIHSPGSNRAAGSPGAADEYPIGKLQAWYMLAMLMLLMVFGLMDRMIIGTLFPKLKEEWGLSDTQLGGLVSATYWGMAVFVIPAAILVDRWSRKQAIVLMATIWTGATIACGMAGNVGHLIIARFFIGAGEGGYNAGAISVVSSIFPERLRTTATSLFSSAGTFGSVLGVAIGGYVATKYGWREAFFAVAAPGLLVVLLFALTARDFKTVALKMVGDDGQQRKMELKDSIRVLFATPSLLALYAGISGVLFMNAAIYAWLPALLNRSDGMTMSDAAIHSALILLAASCGTVLGGVLVDRLKRFGRRVLMLAPAAYALIGALAFILAFSRLSGDLRFAVLCIGGFFLGAIFGPVFAACQTVVHPGLRATVVGVINVIGQIIGGLGPLAAGLLSDAIGLESALALICLSLLAAGIAMLVGASRFEADVLRIEQISAGIEGGGGGSASPLAPAHA